MMIVPGEYIRKTQTVYRFCCSYLQWRVPESLEPRRWPTAEEGLGIFDADEHKMHTIY